MRRGTRAVATAVLAVLLTIGAGISPVASQEPPPPDPAAPLLVGGTRNFLGTGTLLSGAGMPFPAELVHLSVNPYCTNKVNGDRYQSAWFSRTVLTGRCTEDPNSEYRTTGYHYAVEVPDDRAADVEVWLWDARYSEQPLTRPDGRVEQAIDDQRTSGEESFTFSLLAPDATPTDDTDNPIVCSRTFAPSTPYEGELLGSGRWNLLPCAIAPSDPSGRYVVRVQNGGSVTNPLADGSNQFGIVARRTDRGTDAASLLCDSRVDPTCPRVAGSGGHSLKIAAQANQVEMPLVEVPAEEAGRRLAIDLFDPGEGGNWIEVLRPTGAASWTPATFTWSHDGGASGGPTTRLPISGAPSPFNGRLVRMSIDLTGYAPPPGNDQWKVRYTFSGPVTDRTTWDVAVIDTLPGRITGLVAGPSPVEGSTAWLVGTGDSWPRASSTVSDQGRFGFPDLAPGAYQVYVTPPPGSPLVGRWVGGTGPDRGAATRWVVVGDGATVGAGTTTLDAGATLGGTVTSGGWPLADASVKVFGVGEVWLPRVVTTAAADGTWSVAGLATGSYEVLVQPTAGPSVWAPGVPTRAAATPVAVTAGQTGTGVDVDQAGTRAVVGRVTDPAGTGVAGARVALYRPGAYLPSREATTRADGSYAVLDVPDDTYQVRFLPPAGSGLSATWLGSGVRATSTPVTIAGGTSATGVDQALRPA